MPVAKPLTPYREHVQAWRNCTACSLCEDRRKVTFARGDVPCDVLFVGEAPGQTEDAWGQPFVGPAGIMLDRWVAEALDGRPGVLRIAFTNVVSCFPKAQKQTPDHAPPEEAIEACRPKLVEFLGIARPRLVVLVGQVAKRNVPASVLAGRDAVEVVHPASLMGSRKTPAEASLLAKRAVMTLRAAFEELECPF
jgi:uracil-DNA glycosylase family 4